MLARATECPTSPLQDKRAVYTRRPEIEKGKMPEKKRKSLKKPEGDREEKEILRAAPTAQSVENQIVDV